MRDMSDTGRRVLVVCWSTLQNDPRVMREIEWFRSAGWTVDTLGIGPKPSEAVREHFATVEPPALVMRRPFFGLILLFAGYPARFRLMMRSRIPVAATAAVEAGEYDMVFVNDIDFLPWAVDVVRRARRTAPVHLHADLHEYHTPNLEQELGPLRPVLVGYWRWLRRFIPSRQISTRSVVATGISKLYSDEFGVPRAPVVRNTPPFVDQEPSAVDGDRIELVYHGNAAWERGLRLLVEAMRLLDDRFRITFMLTGSPAVIDELKASTTELGDRVTFIPPVPMSQVARAINPFDLEVMLYPPLTPNLELSLPNKLFEAVQGRLGLVVGPSPSMVEIVERYDNGVVAAGFTAPDLVAALHSLTADRVMELKRASARAATELSSEAERTPFLASFELP